MGKKEHEDEEEDFEESEVEETEEEDFDEDEDEEEEDEHEGDDEDEDEDEEDLTEESEVEGKEKAPAPKGAQATAPAQKNEVIKPEELSLTIVVEVGRIQVSVQKLMELQPGNVLDLSVYPENGVDLIVNGRCVGKGELLKVGETLGVRVLDIG